MTRVGASLTANETERAASKKPKGLDTKRGGNDRYFSMRDLLKPFQTFLGDRTVEGMFVVLQVIVERTGP